MCGCVFVFGGRACPGVVAVGALPVAGWGGENVDVPGVRGVRGLAGVGSA